MLLEFADDVIYGLKAIIKTVGAEKGIIVIEDNKPDAIELMQAKTADLENIEVVVAKTKYPNTRSSEQLIKENKVPPMGWAKANVSYALDIGTDGQLLQIYTLMESRTRGEKGNRCASADDGAAAAETVFRYCAAIFIR